MPSVSFTIFKQPSQSPRCHKSQLVTKILQLWHSPISFKAIISSHHETKSHLEIAIERAKLHLQMAQLQILDGVGLLLQERGARLGEQLHPGEKSQLWLLRCLWIWGCCVISQNLIMYGKTKRMWRMSMISFSTQMWFKHIKANEVVNGAMAVDLRAGFGDKSYGSIVLTKYKVVHWNISRQFITPKIPFSFCDNPSPTNTHIQIGAQKATYFQ